MNTIVFSLLVHEEPEVIIDQLVNLFFYNPNSLVVIHINPVFKYSAAIPNYEMLVEKLRSFKGVIINPERLKVGLNDLIQAHISNYRAVQDIDFSYFYFIASNELFLRPGVDRFIQQFDFGCENKQNKDWAFIDIMHSDMDLHRIQKNNDILGYSYSQIEGSFYSKEIMGRMTSIIEKEYDYTRKEVIYPREEIYYPTIANGVFKNDHRYDGCCCKIRWEAGVLFTSLRAVNEIAKQKEDNNFYSVKRVDRQLNNYLRSYIRNHVGKYNNQVKSMCDIEISECPMWKIHFLNGYYLFIYFCRRRIALLYHRLTGTHAD